MREFFILKDQKGGEMHFVKKILGFLLAPFVKGSHVVFCEENRAFKYCRPKLFVRVFYLIFYRRWQSPYEKLSGMQRAAACRRVANHITSFRFGYRVFSSPVGVTSRLVNGRSTPFLVAEWVEGSPADKLEAIQFISPVRDALLKAGFITWAFANPLSYQDVLKRADGRLFCVDLESVLPPLFVSLREHWQMLRAGRFLPLDFIDYGLLKEEVLVAQRSGYGRIQDFHWQVERLIELSEKGGF